MDFIVGILIILVVGWVFLWLIMGMGKAASDFIYYSVHRDENDDDQWKNLK